MGSLALPVPALAEPTPADIESARELYVQGLELRDQNDLAGSLERFRAAQALAPTPITTLELGRAQMLMNQLLEARETLLTVERLPVSPVESHKAAQSRLEAAKLAEQLKARIPAVRIAFSPTPATMPRVTIDGALVPPEALAAPRRVDPGKHTVLAETENARASVEVFLREGETKGITVTLTPTSTGVVNHDENPPPHPPDKPAERPPLGPLFYGGLVVAGAGVLVGAISGAVAFSKTSTLAGECTGVHCPSSAAGDLSASKTWGNVSTVSFVIAGVGAVVAVIALIARPDATAQTASVQKAAGGLRWTWP